MIMVFQVEHIRLLNLSWRDNNKFAVKNYYNEKKNNRSRIEMFSSVGSIFCFPTRCAPLIVSVNKILYTKTRRVRMLHIKINFTVYVKNVIVRWIVRISFDFCVYLWAYGDLFTYNVTLFYRIFNYPTLYCLTFREPRIISRIWLLQTGDICSLFLNSFHLSLTRQ